MHTKIALRLQSSSRLGDTNGMIDTNVSRANCTADLHGSICPIILLDGKSCGVFLVSMNSSSHSSKQDVSVLHMLFGWHADPSWHISAGVFLLWLFKLLHGGQRVRLIQLRGQQGRVIWMLPSQNEGERGAAILHMGHRDAQHHFEEFWPVCHDTFSVQSTFLHL